MEFSINLLHFAKKHPPEGEWYYNALMWKRHVCPELFDNEVHDKCTGFSLSFEVDGWDVKVRLGNRVPFSPSSINFAGKVSGSILEVAGFLAGCRQLMRTLNAMVFFGCHQVQLNCILSNPKKVYTKHNISINTTLGG